jgi:DNA helicase-2/ATP-dependent DNA helicase PcrA
MAVFRVVYDRADNLALRTCLQNIKNFGIGRVGIRNLRKIAENDKTSLWNVLRDGRSIDACGKWGDNYESFADFIDDLENKLSDKTPEECIKEISKLFVRNPTPNINQLLEFSRPLEELPLKDFIQEFNNQRGLELNNENTPATPDQNAVNIMSLHASKGLGFKIVFLIGLEEGFFPNPEQDHDEQRRLCYVAMTRAKEQLFMCYSTNIVGPVAHGARVYRPSSYMTEIPVSCKTIVQN